MRTSQFGARSAGKIHGQLVTVSKFFFLEITSELPLGSEKEDQEWEAELAVGCHGKYLCFCRTVLAAGSP